MITRFHEIKNFHKQTYILHFLLFVQRSIPIRIFLFAGCKKMIKYTHTWILTWYLIPDIFQPIHVFCLHGPLTMPCGHSHSSESILTSQDFSGMVSLGTMYVFCSESRITIFSTSMLQCFAT